MEIVKLSPSGEYTMPSEIQDWEMEQLPDKGVSDHRYLRLGRHTSESLNVYARPDIPKGWKQIRLVQIDHALYIEFKRAKPKQRKNKELPPALRPVQQRRKPIITTTKEV